MHFLCFYVIYLFFNDNNSNNKNKKDNSIYSVTISLSISGQCVSDPDICETSPDYNVHVDKKDNGKETVDDKGLQRGLTVSFWLFITEKDVDTEGQADQKHQYIISSGGQVSTSRGFAILYNAETSRFKIQLQTSLRVYSLDFDLPMADPEAIAGGGGGTNGGWVHVAFTWFSAGEVNYIFYSRCTGLFKICSIHWTITP